MTNEELLQIIRQAARDNATILDFSGKGLTKLPAEIGQLSNLSQLNLRDNQLTKLPAEIGQLSNLSQLNLRDNQLTMLPAVISQLTNLSVLSLGENQLTTLPAEIGQLSKLRQLYLSHNQLTTLPAVISQLTNLSVLSLSENQLTMLPAEIGQLTNLSLLDLRNNQLTTLPAEIGQLTNLSLLDLGGNQLTTLPAVIGQLTNLSLLDLSGNQLTTLPAVISELSKLRQLYLSENQLTTLPAVISELSKLRQLYLSENQLTTLPAVIGQLTNLETLDIRNNQLMNLPSQIQLLTKLKKLDLRGDGNANLQIPPEILGSSRNSLDEPSKILNYYFSLQAEEKQPLNEAKVLLVGQGSVGKTSLVKRLIENSYDSQERKTEGINIKNWQISVNDQSIRLNMWDFGGQEIMHATHQFFLTKRSLYLLVIDARIDERQNELEYWLQMIQSFGGDSPIIIVGNKIDQHPLDLDQAGLRKKYHNIKDIVPVSCQDGRGLNELQSVITQQIADLENIHDPLPKSWFQVKTHLEQLKKDYIPYSEYEKLCQDEKIANTTSQITLIELLHKLGIILNFHDEPRLAEMGVLNPEWVTNAVYKILNDNRLLTKCQGMMDSAELNRILNDPRYPQNKQLFIVDMMQKFELCFPLEDGRFLIPDLLPKEELDTGNWEDVLAFQYHYNVLPTSIISRFIVRMHHHSYQRTWWRSGIVLRYQSNRALIKSDREDRKIFISIDGSLSTRRELLAMIRSQFDAIHQTIKGLDAKEKVPLPNQPNIVVDYEYLRKLEDLGETSFIPPGPNSQKISVKELLDGIESAAERERRRKPHTPENSMSEPPPEPPKPSPQNSPAERGIALGMALVVLMLFVFIVIFLVRQSSTSGQNLLLPLVRLLAAVFAGIIGYLVTGNLGLEAHVPFSKTHIRATGAFAAFIVVLLLFFYGIPASENPTPPKPVSYFGRLM
ncbi:leucine-rich repeat domain-containing protein [Anabaena azotica]|uniref:non-specific serine/threonine protein kinase n=1 Tax=Anabaena azotica FACHB-119 TaxID=947527 RepID=A0ABR8D208_9NOST|nr:COR domain-containing protein [Anabaena azotica]MBD2500458.1 leucine-rich repeat domain-containing protein [Anabaena azotica FACHB-119]